MIKTFIEKLSKKPVYILIFVCLTLFFYKLGCYKLIDVDEPRYAEAAREMLLSKDWITPYFNYVIRLDKPVFFYWLIAICYKIFGINEFAARFPSALFASSTVMFLYYFVRKTISKKVALISAFILASSLEFIVLGRTSITDMTLSFFIVGTIMSGYLGSVDDENKRKYWWWFAYLLSGIAVLTKGPVGFVLPAIILGLHFLLTGQLKENLKPKYIIPGILIFSAITLPWYVLMIKIHGQYFIDYFILKNNFQRFSGVNFTEHSKPFYYYLSVILVGFIPWIFSFIPALIKYVKELILGYKPCENNGEPDESKCCFIKSKYCICKKIALFKNADDKIKMLLLSNIWFFVVLIFFSISSAKLATYVLPLFPAMAILSGLFWHEYMFKGKHKLIINIPIIIFNAVLIIAGLLFI
ncbi:MAG: glycosyltransferase family 39 protein [Candidatus Gastranaerophilaceae bacterium]